MWGLWTAETVVILLGLGFIDASHALECGDTVELVGLTFSTDAKTASDIWLLALVFLIGVCTAADRWNDNLCYSNHLHYRHITVLVLCIIRVLISLDWTPGCVHSIPIIYASVAIPFRITEHVTDSYFSKNQ